VDPAHCSEVYAALGDLLPRLFDVRSRSVEEHTALLEKRYNNLPVLSAYFMARCGAAKHCNKSEQVAETYLTKAKEMSFRAPVGLAKRCFNSFLERWFCIVHAQDPEKVTRCLKRSKEFMMFNANIWYLSGVRLFQFGRGDAAADDFRSSLALDPDFKGPYMYLGAIFLRGAQWSDALEVSEAGQSRHPSPHFQYHMGVALAHLASMSADGVTSGAEIWLRDGDRNKRALECLQKARDSPEGLARKRVQKSPWHPYDDELLDYLQRRLHKRGESNTNLKVPTIDKAQRHQIGWTVHTKRA